MRIIAALLLALFGYFDLQQSIRVLERKQRRLHVRGRAFVDITAENCRRWAAIGFATTAMWFALAIVAVVLQLR